MAKESLRTAKSETGFQSLILPRRHCEMKPDQDTRQTPIMMF